MSFPYSEEWPRQYEAVADGLHRMLTQVPVVSIQHVGSTSVPGLAAKPVLDIDVIVQREHVPASIRALSTGGYTHLGDLGLCDREAFHAEQGDPARNVYLCVEETLNVRNHLAVRSVLRAHPDLREAYGAVKRELAEDPDMTIDRYVAGKSEILQMVLDHSELTTEEKLAVLHVNVNNDVLGS